MTADGAEVRFWVYFDTTNQFRTVDDFALQPTADRASFIQFSNNGDDLRLHQPRGQPERLHHERLHLGGHLRDRLDRSSASSTTSRTQTYTLSKRASATDPWTQLKAAARTGYAIPFRGANTITATHGMLFRAYQNANLWLDDVAFADGGIVEAADTTPPTAPAALLAADTPADPGGSIDLSWAAATDDVGVTGYKLYRGTAAGRLRRAGRARRRHGLHRRHGRHRHALLLRRQSPSTPPATRAPSRPRPPRSRSTTPRRRHGGTLSTPASRPAPTARRLAPAWTLSGAPQRREYDSARAKNGALSGWIQGPTTRRLRRRGRDGLGRHDRQRRRDPLLGLLRHHQPVPHARGLRVADRRPRLLHPVRQQRRHLRLHQPRGQPERLHHGGYTSVGTYATGWTAVPHRLRLRRPDLHAVQARERVRRLDAAQGRGATGYAIPFRGANTITATHGMLFRAYQNANLWLDDLAFANGGIVDAPQ